jgi:hypothetical protein
MNGERIFFTSTAITSVLFSCERAVLEVEFRNGLAYEYLGVSTALYEQLLASPSKGAFFVRFIRDRFPHRRVDRSRELTQ